MVKNKFFIIIKSNFIILLCFSCTNPKNGKIANLGNKSNSLIFNVDSSFFSDVDTTNFQNFYNSKKTDNFNYNYFFVVFLKSTQSCLYCLVNNKTKVLTPFPVWTCDVLYKINSDTIFAIKNEELIPFKWLEKENMFLKLNNK